MATSLSPLDPRVSVLGDQVYASLGEAILDGTLAPGEVLRDHELAARLGVSRTPVREALQRLERSGLVEVSPHRYTRVSVPDPKTVRDTGEFVAYTVGNCMRIAATRCSDSTLATLVEHLDRVVAAAEAGDEATLRAASADILRITVRATENVAFAVMMREADMAIRRNLALAAGRTTDSAQRSAAYARLRDAVARRDGIEAEAMVRELHGYP